MFSTVLNAGKELANKLSNRFLNLSDVEAKVKEATNEEPWGPHGSLMRQIAADTFSTMNFNDVMTFLWYRVFLERPVQVRRTYKGLVLLAYLIGHGSEYVAVSCREHLLEVRRLARGFCGPDGVPDQNVRKKAGDIVELLTDPDRLRAERQRARESQQRIHHQQHQHVQPQQTADRSQEGTVISCGNGSGKAALGSFDDWNPAGSGGLSELGTNGPWAAIGESFSQFVTVFTQNISGPPPTETHDNFDIPPDVEFCREARDVSPGAPVRVRGCSGGSSEPGVAVGERHISNLQRPQPAMIAAAPELKSNETPIIDFTDPPAQPPTSHNMIMDILCTPTINSVCMQNTANQSEFGDFAAWSRPCPNVTNQLSQPVNSTQQLQFDPFMGAVVTKSSSGLNAEPSSCHLRNVMNTAQSHSASFTPDFNCLPTVNNNQNSGLASGINSSHNSPPDKTGQSAAKVSDTWKEIGGGLKIDLDNLCGRQQQSSLRS